MIPKLIKYKAGHFKQISSDQLAYLRKLIAQMSQKLILMISDEVYFAFKQYNTLRLIYPIFFFKFRAEGIYQSMKSFYGSSVCHMLMINSRNAEQYTPNLPDPWAQFIISTSKKTFVSCTQQCTLLFHNGVVYRKTVCYSRFIANSEKCF